MREPSVFRAALWMAGWLTAMLAMSIAGREAGQELHTFQVMFMRSFIGFLFLMPVVAYFGGYKAIKSQYPLRHVVRNCVHYIGQFSWFLSLTLIPLAQVVSIEFTLPVWTAILATLFLGERMTRWKWAAIVFGVVGVLVIVRPGITAVNAGQIAALIAAVGFGFSNVLTKRLTRNDTALTIMFYMVIVQMVVGFLPALMVWQWPSGHIWAWIIIVGFVGTVSHYCLASAMSYADATIVVPMDFLRVPLTAMAGWLVYNEYIDALTVVGAGLILSGNLLNLKSSNNPATPRGGSHK